MALEILPRLRSLETAGMATLEDGPVANVTLRELRSVARHVNLFMLPLEFFFLSPYSSSGAGHDGRFSHSGWILVSWPPCFEWLCLIMK